MLSCAKARATGSQACTRRSGLRAMTCPSVTADVGNMLHRARPRWAIAKFCADILANRVGGGSPGCRGGGGGCVSGCVGHCGLGAGYVARYAACRVTCMCPSTCPCSATAPRGRARLRDRVPVCTGRPNLERTQCTTLHIAAAWCETGPTRNRRLSTTPEIRVPPTRPARRAPRRALASVVHRGPWWIQMGRDDGVLDLGQLYIHTS